MNAFDKIAKNPLAHIAYSGEVMLRDHDGEYISLWLDGTTELKPAKKSPEHPDRGTRYMMVLVEIGDDGQPIDIDMREKFVGVVKEMVKPMTTPEKVVKQAALLCKDRDFHRFVHTSLKEMTDDQKLLFFRSGVPRWLTDLGLGSFNQPEHAEEWAKYYLYYRCNIHSRKQLGFRNEYKDKFYTVLKDFTIWGERNGNR